MSGQKKAIVFLCEGAEEMEFTISGNSLKLLIVCPSKSIDTSP